MNVKQIVRRLTQKLLGAPYPEWQFVRDMWIPMTDDLSKYIEQVYKGNVYGHAIISHISDKASDAPGQVYRIKDKRKASAYKTITKMESYTAAAMAKAAVLKSQAFDEVENHPFIDLIEKPNPIMTGKQLRREVLGYQLITGNSYLYAATPGVGQNAAKPKELWPIPSPCVTIVEGDRFNPIQGYKVSYYNDDMLPEAQVMHMKSFNPVGSPQGGNWLYGMSPIRALRNTISQFEAADIAQGTLFKNLGPGGILHGDEKGALSEAQGLQIQDKFVQKHTGLHNGGGIIVTPAKVSFQEIGMSPVDLNIIAAKGDMLQEIAAVYKYPKERITGSQNVSSQGMADKQVITSCVMPLLRDFDDSVTAFIRKLYKDESLVYISDTQYFPELQEDREKLAQWLSQAWWIKVNEKRAAMDYDEEPDGDVMLIPAGLIKLQDAIADIPEPDDNLLEDADALDK